METETKIYLGAAIVFPVLTALFSAAACWLIDLGDFIRRCRINAQRRSVDRWEEYVGAWESAEENYPGAYTDQVAEHRQALERERAKLEQYEKRLPSLEKVPCPRN